MAQPLFNSASQDVDPPYVKAAAAVAEAGGTEKVSYRRVTNPVTVLYAAEGAALRGQASAIGTALAAITPDVGFDEIDAYPGAVRAVDGSTLPTDCVVRVDVTKVKNALGQFTFQPNWVLVGNALNTAIAAITVGTLECDIRLIQRKRANATS